MEHRPPNPRGQRETIPPREDRYQAPPRGRREEPRARESYPPYRQEPSYAAPAVEDVLEEVSALQRTVAKLAESQPARDDVLGAVRDLEGVFRQKLTEYYPADIVDAKLAERTRILDTVRSELEDMRQKMQASRQDNKALVRDFIQGFWNTWQARTILAANIALAGIFTGVVLLDLLQAALGKK